LSISYHFAIRQTNQTNVGSLSGVVTHIHFDYVGTSPSGRVVSCQGVVPFTVADRTIDTAEGEKVIKGDLDPNSFIPAPEVTEAVLLSWLEERVPAATIQLFQKHISERIAQMEEGQ
jgi:hypothetical protein